MDSTSEAGLRLRTRVRLAFRFLGLVLLSAGFTVTSARCATGGPCSRNCGVRNDESARVCGSCGHSCA